MNDVALLRQVADRQAEALCALYDRYASTLLALGKRILGSVADAEEVLQEVFLHVWNHARRYDAGRSSVSTWLILITRSRAIDRLRTRKVVERTHETSARGIRSSMHPPRGWKPYLYMRGGNGCVARWTSSRRSSGRSSKWRSTRA